MNSSNNAVSRGPRGLIHAAAVLALGCSAGMGDSASDGPTSEVAQELRQSAPHAPPSQHHPVPPPHHPGQGHGAAGSCNQPPGAAGFSGSNGAAGSASGTGGFASGAGGSTGEDPSGGAAGSSEGGFTASGGASEGGASSGGAMNFPDPCGDGVRFTNQCDDGNTVSGDGCSDACVIEPGYACDTPGAPCRQQRCGDGFQDLIFTPGDPAASGGAGGDVFGAGGAAGGPGTFFFEACDDGNTASGDGCSATCDIEPGFICTAPGTLCHEPRCGDGYQDFITAPGGGPATAGAANGTGGTGGGGAFPAAGGSAGAGGAGSFEGCDDGNTASGDGCSATCDVEDGYICFQPNTPCRKPRCGDGVVDFFYPSNDSGTASGGAGTGAGGAETGGVATGAGGLATGGSFATGGAGGAGSVEQCDDGNTVSGDGCSATCQVE
jgi:cysteine-rich repeat protein